MLFFNLKHFFLPDNVLPSVKIKEKKKKRQAATKGCDKGLRGTTSLTPKDFTIKSIPHFQNDPFFC